MAKVAVPNHPPIPRASAWGSAPASKPCSLAVVMDEQYAGDLQRQEEAAVMAPMPEAITQEVAVAPVVADASIVDATDSDALLAMLLQEEEDRKYDAGVRAQEKHMNQSSSVTVSWQNHYRSQHSAEAFHSGSGSASTCSEEDDEAKEFGAPRDCAGSGGGRGKKKRGRGRTSIPTKHDLEVSGRKNACDAERCLPPGVPVGPLQSGDDIKLSNTVYNSLSQHMRRKDRETARSREKRDIATLSHALDDKTTSILGKLIMSGELSRMDGCISQGKEACVFRALGANPVTEEEVEHEEVEAGEEEEDQAALAPPPMNTVVAQAPEVAVKVYKTTLNEFKTRERYIRGDVRFSDRYSTQNPRKIVHLWAEKEMRNLKRLHRHGLPCPEPLVLRDHILIMSFIGENELPAPQLYMAKMSSSALQTAYEQTLQLMTRMYQDCHLIHADLSEYNLLWHQNRLHVIDVSQAVEPWHPEAMEFLQRDARNIVNFFRKAGVKKVLSIREVMSQVTGIDVDEDLTDNEFLKQMKKAVDTSAKCRQFVDDGSPVEEEDFEKLFARATAENSRKRRLKQEQEEDDDLDIDNI